MEPMTTRFGRRSGGLCTREYGIKQLQLHARRGRGGVVHDPPCAVRLKLEDVRARQPASRATSAPE
jgi:hypothetical protein